MGDELRHDYAQCTECTRSNAITVVQLFGQEIAFRRFNGSHTDMWARDGDSWYCPKHAHIAMDMDRAAFEDHRDAERLE